MQRSAVALLGPTESQEESPDQLCWENPEPSKNAHLITYSGNSNLDIIFCTDHLHPNLKSCTSLRMIDSVCFLRIRVLKRPSCSTWLVRFTLPQTAVPWTCPRTSCAATWSTPSLTSPASTGKITSHLRHHTGRMMMMETAHTFPSTPPPTSAKTVKKTVPLYTEVRKLTSVRFYPFIRSFYYIVKRFILGFFLCRGAGP